MGGARDDMSRFDGASQEQRRRGIVSHYGRGKKRRGNFFSSEGPHAVGSKGPCDVRQECSRRFFFFADALSRRRPDHGPRRRRTGLATDGASDDATRDGRTGPGTGMAWHWRGCVGWRTGARRVARSQRGAPPIRPFLPLACSSPWESSAPAGLRAPGRMRAYSVPRLYGHRGT